MKILIAFDIDGTLTDASHKIPSHLINFFKEISNKGILISFITGRPSNWALNVLKKINVPYILATHNGAKILSMPKEEIINENYLNLEDIKRIENIQNNCFVYLEDKIYFISKNIEDSLLEYMENRAAEFNETLIPLSSFEILKDKSISSIKYFSKDIDFSFNSAEAISKLGFSTYSIGDPFSSNYYITQITHPNATKGKSIICLKEFLNPIDFVIAIGDDKNDIPMFKEADISLVMSKASDSVKKYADYVIDDIASSVKSLLLQKGIF